MPRARRTTPTGRITAGAIPSLGFPLSARALVVSTTPPGHTVSAASPAATVPRLSMAQQVSIAQRGWAVSAPASDTWAVSPPGPETWAVSATDDRLPRGLLSPDGADLLGLGSSDAALPLPHLAFTFFFNQFFFG